MRPLEALLAAAVILVLVMRWQQPRGRQVTGTMLAMIGILLVLHLAFDGWRWEMILTYGMALMAGWILSRDLGRVSGAKAGESSQWIAVPSTGKRIARGVPLFIAAFAAVVIPALVFPRIALPEPDGLYWVGRLEMTWTDSARGNRAVVTTVWYPAEQPNGRTLRYHPQPSALGSTLGHGSSLPGFTFRNLTAARTHATRDPRFSVREGRSPIVLVSPDSGASRYESSALFEQLASHGYVIASVGDEGDAAGVVADLAQRTADLTFVLNKLVALPAGGVIDTLGTHVRIDRIALIGRGAGAAAALELAAGEPRVNAVVAIAPGQLGPAATGGVRRPVLMFTVRDATPGLDDALRYGGTEARLEGASDATLSDRALLGKPITSMLGIESGDAPRDVHAAVSALTLRFFDQYLKDRRAETEVGLPSRVRVTIVPHQPRAG
jgi:predicted dienelactone hydrolase